MDGYFWVADTGGDIVPALTSEKSQP